MESIMGLQEALPALLDLPGQGVGPSTPWNPPAGTKVPDPLHENGIMRRHHPWLLDVREPFRAFRALQSSDGPRCRRR